LTGWTCHRCFDYAIAIGIKRNADSMHADIIGGVDGNWQIMAYLNGRIRSRRMNSNGGVNGIHCRCRNNG
jgi:hypothetical protein